MQTASQTAFFQETIIGWESWGHVFQSAKAFYPLAASIFSERGLPVPKELEQLPPGTNAVFRAGKFVIKLFAPIESGLDTEPDFAAELSSMVAAKKTGIQTANVVCFGERKDRYLFRYLILSYLDAAMAKDYLPQQEDAKRTAFAQELRSLLDGLHQKNPRPFPLAGLKQRAAENARLNGLPVELIADWQRRIEAVSLNPCVLVHGDCTGENLLVGKNSELSLIDYADSCAAPACYEHPPVVFDLFLHCPELVRIYAGECGPDEFIEEVLDGLALHDFGGDLWKQYCHTHGGRLENFHTMNEIGAWLKGRLF